ncbi:MAG: DUF1553 domain-containing protein [Planctomycetota bacterium]|nr:MAG: DUF1553 domain-containing protein [Planctomycetota bacterium]
MLPSLGILFCCSVLSHQTPRRGFWFQCGRKMIALLVTLASVGGFTSAHADDLLPAETEISQAVDHYIRQHLSKEGIAAVGMADDLTLQRRTTLDLAGRVPTPIEQQWFLSQPEADRRRLLVDRLMQLPDFDFHHRNWLDETLLPNQPYNDEFRNYLLTAVQGRRSWETMFREIMKAAGTEAPEKGANHFLSSRVRELDDLTNDTAILFFGVNISCAKCHDHPLVADWKQDHFYGMQSFFKRTYQTRKTNSLAERPFGEVKFATVSGESKQASFMFLTGDVAADRTPQPAEEERKALEERVRKLEQDDVEAEILIPEFRPRDELVELALHDSKDRFFASNIVNRVWARLLGTGIVDPLDQMHSGNSPSHPQLLEWLTNDLVSHGYDLRRLIQGIVLSEAYGRSSEWTSGSEPPAASTFAMAKTRPMTPRQLGASLHVVIRNTSQWPAIENSDEWTNRRTELENQANGWVREFEQPGENFQIAVDEALFFSNSNRIQDDLLRDSDDRLLGQLKKEEDQSKAIEQLWMTVLNRSLQPEELSSATAWVDRDPAQKDEARRQLLWALLAGPEFRFNY